VPEAGVVKIDGIPGDTGEKIIWEGLSNLLLSFCISVMSSEDVEEDNPSSD